MPTKRKTPVKQKQKQTQSVRVVVNLDSKKKGKRKPRKRAQKSAQMPVDYKAFPPQIIYPSEPLTFYNRGVAPQASGLSSLEKVPEPKSMLEDIGTVGTSEILPSPSKKEQLADIEDVVPLKPASVGITLAQVAKDVYMPKSFADLPDDMSEMTLSAPPRWKTPTNVSLYPETENMFEARNPMLTEGLGLTTKARRARMPVITQSGFTKNTKKDLEYRYRQYTDAQVPKITVGRLKELVEQMEGSKEK